VPRVLGDRRRIVPQCDAETDVGVAQRVRRRRSGSGANPSASSFSSARATALSKIRLRALSRDHVPPVAVAKASRRGRGAGRWPCVSVARCRTTASRILRRAPTASDEPSASEVARVANNPRRVAASGRMHLCAGSLVGVVALSRRESAGDRRAGGYRSGGVHDGAFMREGPAVSRGCGVTAVRPEREWRPQRSGLRRPGLSGCS
jgi:hypothetical protein